MQQDLRIAAGVGGTPFIVIFFAGLVAGAHSAEFATTETYPDAKLDGTLN